MFHFADDFLRFLFCIETDWLTWHLPVPLVWHWWFWHVHYRNTSKWCSDSHIIFSFNHSRLPFFLARIWWPCIVIIFYALSVIPTLIAKRSMQSSLSGTTPCFEFAIFLTMGFIVCSFAYPIVLNRAEVVSPTRFFYAACDALIQLNFIFRSKPAHAFWHCVAMLLST